MTVSGQLGGQGESLVGAVSEADLRASMGRIRGYCDPYRDLLVRAEQGTRLVQMIEGLTSVLERKSVEPIAVMHGIERRNLQQFVGTSQWDYDPLREQQRREMAREIGNPDAALVLDGSATPKKGNATVGVARQWCGRHGKVDSCVVGVYAVYVGVGGLASIADSQIYLPPAWADDRKRRAKVYVPEDVEYRSQPKMALEMTRTLAAELPFEWVLGDDEFGRSREVRDGVWALGKSYVFDVPCDTRVRLVGHKKIWRADAMAKSRSIRKWKWLRVRDGEKGPCEVVALALPVMTKRDGARAVAETLVVIEEPWDGRVTYCLARSRSPASLGQLVQHASQRHRVEEVFEEAKGEVGLDHFEVRAWHGWHHHMTLCQLAHWFLVREKRRLGKKSSRLNCEHDQDGYRSSAVPRDNRQDGVAGELPSGAERGRPPSTLASARIYRTSSPADAVNRVHFSQ